MDRLETFTPLLCHACQGKAFVKVVGLSVRAQSGTIETQGGYQCVECKAMVDLHHMQAQAEMRRLKEEMAERQSQLDVLTQAQPHPAPMGDALRSLAP